MPRVVLRLQAVHIVYMWALHCQVDDDMFESKQNEQNVEAEKLKEAQILLISL